MVKQRKQRNIKNNSAERITKQVTKQDLILIAWAYVGAIVLTLCLVLEIYFNKKFYFEAACLSALLYYPMIIFYKIKIFDCN